MIESAEMVSTENEYQFIKGQIVSDRSVSAHELLSAGELVFYRATAELCKMRTEAPDRLIWK